MWLDSSVHLCVISLVSTRVSVALEEAREILVNKDSKTTIVCPSKKYLNCTLNLYYYGHTFVQYDGINERTEMLTETWSILILKRITLKVMMIEYMVDTTQKCINLCISSHDRNQKLLFPPLYCRCETNRFELQSLWCQVSSMVVLSSQHLVIKPDALEPNFCVPI